MISANNTKNTSNTVPAISAIILAGGRGSRMDGQDKGLVNWRGKPLIEHTLAAITAQVDDIVISCNRNVATYKALGHTAVTDDRAGYQGPLAGISAAYSHCQHALIYICPCDCPLASGDIIRTLAGVMLGEGTDTNNGPDVVAATDGKQRQALFMLANAKALASIDSTLAAGQRSVKRWQDTLRLAEVDISAHPQWFKNVNQPEDLSE